MIVCGRCGTQIQRHEFPAAVGRIYVWVDAVDSEVRCSGGSSGDPRVMTYHIPRLGSVDEVEEFLAS